MKKVSSFKFQVSKHRGFTLVETLMALFVLMVGVVTGFAVISQAIHISPITRQQIIAANLAQEAIEIVRNIRDRRLLIIADGIKSGRNPIREWTYDINACANNAEGTPDEYHSFPQLGDITDRTGLGTSGGNPDPGWYVDCEPGSVGDRPFVFRHQNTGFLVNICDKQKCQKNHGHVTTNGYQETGFRRAMAVYKYVNGVRDNSCTTNCTELRVKVKSYFGTNEDPSLVPCPAENCILAEDRLTGWMDYLDSYL